MTRPITNSKNNLFGVRFMPGMASSFKKLSINRLTDQIVDISSINGRKTSSLTDRLVHAGNYQEQRNILNKVLRNVFPSQPLIEKETKYAINSIYCAGGSINIQEAAKKVGWTRQHLSRKFVLHTGITPKFFASVIRANKLIKIYKTNNTIGFAEIA
jgi:AraC-like DNA-binding protein